MIVRLHALPKLSNKKTHVFTPRILNTAIVVAHLSMVMNKRNLAELD